MTQPYKVCPLCRQPAAIELQVCRRCGHVYRTAPPPPLDRTQIVYPTQQPEPTQFLMPQPGPQRDLQAWPQQPQQPYIVQASPRWMDTTMPIWGMWASVVASAFSASFDMLAGIMGVASIVLAIMCVCTPHRAHRVNGWVVIGLHIAGLMMFVGLGMAASGNMP